MNDEDLKKMNILREHQRNERQELAERMKIYSKNVKEVYKPKISLSQQDEHQNARENPTSPWARSSGHADPNMLDPRISHVAVPNKYFKKANHDNNFSLEEKRQFADKKWHLGESSGREDLDFVKKIFDSARHSEP